MPVTVDQPCDSSTSKCPRDNVCLEIPFRVSLYHKKSSQLITIRDKLAGFFMVQFLLKCIYEQILVYVRKRLKSALLKVSQNNNPRDSHVYKC